MFRIPFKNFKYRALGTGWDTYQADKDLIEAPKGWRTPMPFTMKISGEDLNFSYLEMKQSFPATTIHCYQARMASGDYVNVNIWE